MRPWRRCWEPVPLLRGSGRRALAALLDPGFLAQAGWDPATWLLAPETEHRLIRWDGSRRRQEDAPARRAAPLPAPGPGTCAVTACLRERRTRRGREETRCALHARRWEAVRGSGRCGEDQILAFAQLRG